jgi:hypothetical protein
MFGYAQHQGWNMFDNVANPSSGGFRQQRRVYHEPAPVAPPPQPPLQPLRTAPNHPNSRPTTNVAGTKPLLPRPL